MEQNNIISSERLLDIANMNSEYVKLTWNGVQLVVKYILQAEDYISLVDNILSSCLSEDKYIPELIDFAIRSNIVLRYSNAELPKDLESQYKVLYSTDLYDEVCKHICAGQLDSIMSAINRLIR